MHFPRQARDEYKQSFKKFLKSKVCCPIPGQDYDGTNTSYDKSGIFTGSVTIGPDDTPIATYPVGNTKAKRLSLFLFPTER
jgi:hypothetical protein